jgi:gliding motility-associated-like protein
VAPDNDATNVTIITDITWQYAPTATFYTLSIGTTPGGVDILDNLNVGNVLSYEPEQDLPQDTRIHVLIKPFNENGMMMNCSGESFFTGSAVDYCEPFIDESTGELVILKPEIQFPDIVGICSDELPYIITTEDSADGFRWYRTNSGSPETLLSEHRDAPVTEPGRYLYEAFNSRIINGREVICTDSKLFTVVVSEKATINSIDVFNLPDGKQVTISVSGSGNYEFALDSVDGPYQEHPVFTGVQGGQHLVYIRDQNGCGIVERTVDRDLTVDDFPNFFTPNGDGINDLWSFISPPENFGITVDQIAIYDRYGIMLALLIPDSQGWNGEFNGRPLPASDYWFKATVSNGQEVKGHFSLKR